MRTPLQANHGYVPGLGASVLRIAGILAYQGAAILDPQLLLDPDSITPKMLGKLFLSLVVVAATKERAQEVYVTAWRGPGRTDLEAALKQAAPADKEAAEQALASSRATTGRQIALVSLALGICVSLVGVRTLAPLFPRSNTSMFLIDVVLTGGLLAGGSKAVPQTNVRRQHSARKQPKSAGAP